MARKHNCFDPTWGSVREALLNGSTPGKINTPKFCKSCKRWYIEVREMDGR